MTLNHSINSIGIGRGRTRPQEWEMVSAFGLSVVKDIPALKECRLEPLVKALEPLGLPEEQICAISAAVEQTGEDLRLSCPQGRLECVDVRVNVSATALEHPSAAPWDFFVIKTMASSESDNLTDEPCCYIDLYILHEE